MNPDSLDARLADLRKGPRWITYDDDGFVSEFSTTPATEWMIAAANAVQRATAGHGLHASQAEDVTSDLGRVAISRDEIFRMQGILGATLEDRRSGVLGNIQYAIYAETFDDFLDVADELHKDGKVMEPAILASAVLEDTFKKIAAKNGVDPNRQLDPIITDLTKTGAFTTLDAKRARFCAGVRKHAFHAEWGELDTRSVGELISNIRAFVGSHLN